MDHTIRLVFWAVSVVTLLLFMFVTLVVCFPLFVLTSTISLIICSIRFSHELFRKRSELGELKSSFLASVKTRPSSGGLDITLGKDDYTVKQQSQVEG